MALPLVLGQVTIRSKNVEISRKIGKQASKGYVYGMDWYGMEWNEVM